MSGGKTGAGLPRGFAYAAAHCGIRKKRSDLGVVVAERGVSAAGIFTKNRVKAAPVLVTREHLRASRGRARAIVVNSGNANCSTGAAGMAASRETALALARELGCVESEILVCSTGVIGLPLDAGLITGALPALLAERARTAETFEAFSNAIMTTDTRPKRSFARCRLGMRTVRIAGCAKGAGMIHPQMATMLAFLTTDAAVPPALLSRLLRRVAERTFNAISVDGDTSTNDTVLLLASGDSGALALRSGTAETQKFERALERVCADLALQIVADGEGASHVVEIEVRGAPSDRAARLVAETIATSPLVKTALAGADPNWGRILAAAGRAGVRFDPDRVRVWMAGRLVCRQGTPVPFDEADLHRRLLEPKFSLAIDLGAGSGSARMWTCDITAEYVRINASYRT